MGVEEAEARRAELPPPGELDMIAHGEAPGDDPPEDFSDEDWSEYDDAYWLDWPLR